MVLSSHGFHVFFFLFFACRKIQEREGACWSFTSSRASCVGRHVALVSSMGYLKPLSLARWNEISAGSGDDPYC